MIIHVNIIINILLTKLEGEVYFELSKNYEKKKLINRAFEYINLAISSLGISSTNQGGEMEKFKRYLYSLYN